MENVKRVFEYMKLSDNLICRYSLGPDKKAFHVVGEVYDNESGKWALKASTMKYKMSGEGNKISEKEALEIIEGIKKKNKK